MSLSYPCLNPQYNALRWEMHQVLNEETGKLEWRPFAIPFDCHQHPGEPSRYGHSEKWWCLACWIESGLWK